MPWPLASRELYVCDSALVVKEKKGILLIQRSPDENKMKNWGFDLKPEDPERVVRADMCKGFTLLEYIDEDSCWLTGFININPKFAYIPDWFLNYLVKRSIY